MSEESALVNIEDDGPATPEPVAVAPAVPEHETPPVTEDPDTASVDAVEVGGVKYVPLGAVKGERDRRQQAETKVQEQDRWINENKPYVDFIRNNPQLLQRPAAPEPVTPSVDPKLEQIARTLDLYTAEGKPDLERAKTFKALVSSEAHDIAQQAIQPYAQQTAQERSSRNFQAALGMKDAQGRSPSEKALRQVWGIMPVDQTADPNVAGILALTAMGMDAINTKPAPAPPAGPPVVTESAGGHPRTRPGLSPLEQRIAKDKGIKESDWAKHTENFQSGRSHQLED